MEENNKPSGDCRYFQLWVCSLTTIFTKNTLGMGIYQKVYEAEADLDDDLEDILDDVSLAEDNDSKYRAFTLVA